MNLLPDYSLLAIMVIFLLNYLVVRKFFFEPINRVLEEREVETRGAEKVYDEALARFNEATAQMESQLHAAKRDAAQLREKFRGEAATHRQQVVERTSAEGKAIVAEADQKLDREVDEARESIKRDSESLARLAAERILGRAV